MAITIQRASDETAYVRFALPEQDDVGAVSVVGSFNDWTPGAHQMQVDDNGGLSVMIEVPYGQEIHFRYLGDGDRWFDDDDADLADDGGHIQALESGELPQPQGEPSLDLDATVIDLNTGHVSASGAPSERRSTTDTR